VNAIASHLATSLRGHFVWLPGATSVTIHVQETWALLLIIASSDAAVILLGKKLGLNCELRKESGWWRRIAIGESEGGALRCEVSGPRSQGEPH
jgi:hypothetical protein